MYDMRAHDGASVEATGPACGRSHGLWPWPDQEAHERKKNWVADETLAIHE